MFIPFISSASNKRVRYRRRGGGGGGSGSGGGSSGGGGRGGSTGGGSIGGGSSSGGSSSGGGFSGGGSRGGSGGSSSSGGSSGGGRPPVSIGSGASTGGRTSARPYGNGGGSMATIPSGQPFAGRSVGGGTRGQIYGTSVYGSGYPGSLSRGVAGLGFPYYFWPVVWGSAAVGGGAAYLHNSEYGEPNNSSRPGGTLVAVPFSSSSGNMTLHIIADNSTTTSLLSSIASNCSSVLAPNSTGSQAVVAFDPSSNSSSMPKPEQAVQYYRASSIALTLDGYNNTVALNESASLNDTQTPLPSWINTNMLDCVNRTIGVAAPLVDAATSIPIMFGTHTAAITTFAWLLIHVLKGIL